MLAGFAKAGRRRRLPDLRRASRRPRSRTSSAPSGRARATTERIGTSPRRIVLTSSPSSAAVSRASAPRHARSRRCRRTRRSPLGRHGGLAHATTPCHSLGGQRRERRASPTRSPRPLLRTRYDVCVATHQIGSGWILYAGDVNCEPHTVKLVASFVQSKAPAAPISSLARLPDAEFEAAMATKAEGNALFTEGKLPEAIAKYGNALELYGSRAGEGEQRTEKVKILSNLAECDLRARTWKAAYLAASAALRLDAKHPKSLLRRAKVSVSVAQYCRRCRRYPRRAPSTRSCWKSCAPLRRRAPDSRVRAAQAGSRSTSSTSRMARTSPLAASLRAPSTGSDGGSARTLRGRR